MIKNITKIGLILLLTFTFGLTKVKAQDNKKVNYYLNKELSEEIEAYYEIGSSNYPLIEGYIFEYKIENDKEVNLYYATRTFKVILLGNGGTFEGESEVILKDDIKYGEEFDHNPNLYQNIKFEKPGFNLLDYERNFTGKKVTVKEDVYYYATWRKTEINHKFIIGSKEYEVSQKLGTNIVFPIITENLVFTGFRDLNNNHYDQSYIVDSEEELVLIAEFDDIPVLPNITSSTIGFPIINNEVYTITIDDEDVLGTNLDGYVLFENLQPGTSYNFKKTDSISTSHFNLKTKDNILNKHFAIPITNYSGHLILNSEYNYYLNGELIKSNMFLLDLNNGNQKITVENRDFNETSILTRADIEFLDEEDSLNYYYTSDSIDFNFSKSTDYIFIENQEFKYFNGIGFNKKNALINSDYYLIYKLEGSSSYFFKDLSIKRPSLNYYLYENKLVINNEGRNLIKFNGEESSESLVVFTNFDNGNIHYFDFYTNQYTEEFYRFYFYSSEIKEVNLEDIQIDIFDKEVSLSNLPLDYQVGISIKNDSSGTKWFDSNQNKVLIKFLNPNTDYDIFIKDIYGEVTKVDTIRTKKLSSEDVEVPLYTVRVDSITTSSITILNNNRLLEYSLDNETFICSDEDKITFSGLESFKTYTIYARYKETTLEESSKGVLVGKVKTIVEEPSLESFKDLVITFKSISFEAIAGYNYYYNNVLIKDGNFNIDNLDPNSTHNFKVVRISDGLEFIHSIRLKNVGDLADEEKIVEYQVSDSSVTIKNSKTNFIYILIGTNGKRLELRGNGNDLIFEGLTSNLNYNLAVIKDAIEEVYYYSEEIGTVYIPKDIKQMIISYMNQQKIKQTTKNNDIIEEYVKLSRNVKSKSEFDLLYEEAITLISASGKTLNIIIIASVALVLGTITLIVVLRSKKKRKVVKK